LISDKIVISSVCNSSSDGGGGGTDSSGNSRKDLELLTPSNSCCL